MMRTLWITGAALLLVTGGAAARTGVGIGVGAFGGLNVPILQDDADASGTVFGLRVPVRLIPRLSVEPYVATSSLGGTEIVSGGVAYTRSGFDVTTVGLNVALANLVDGPSINIYPFAGIGSTTLKRAEDPDVTETTYTGGVGFTLRPQSQVGLHFRAEAVVVSRDDVSRKFAQGTFGLTYALSGH